MACPVLLSLTLCYFDCTPGPELKKKRHKQTRDLGQRIFSSRAKKKQLTKNQEKGSLSPCALEAGQNYCTGEKVLSIICIYCWHGYSLVHVKLGHCCWGMSVQMARGVWPGSSASLGWPSPLQKSSSCVGCKANRSSWEIYCKLHGEKGWPGFPVSCLAGSWHGCWVRQLSKLTFPFPEGHGETLAFTVAFTVASTSLPQHVEIIYEGADVPRPPACDAMAGPGEQSLADHSWNFCLWVTRTHHSCLGGQRKGFTGATAKFKKKKKKERKVKNSRQRAPNNPSQT